jgi:uncharacterized protein (TIGR02117 family)
MSVLTRVLRRILRIGVLIVLSILAIGILYVASSVPGALLRPEPKVPTPDDQHAIFLIWSDIHTDIILPVQGISVNWTEVLADTDAPSPPPPDGYIAVGWGSESFYTRAPTMDDVSVGLVAQALFFDATVVHTTPIYNPMLIRSEYRKTMLISGQALAALEQYVLSSFALTADGKADALPRQTHGYGDAFYRAHGRYNPMRTCNQWTSDGLRLAGVPVGYWTPFSQAITWVLGTDADALELP